MAGKRKTCSADFKAKVALEDIRSEATIAELVAKHGVHQTVIHFRRRPSGSPSGTFLVSERT